MTARRVTDLHVRSVSLDPGESSVVVDHGLIVDQDGRKPIRIHSLDVDDQGHAFMTRDCQLLPGEKGTLRHDRHRDGTNLYKELARGQFFAVASVTVPGKPAKPWPGQCERDVAGSRKSANVRAAGALRNGDDCGKVPSYPW